MKLRLQKLLLASECMTWPGKLQKMPSAGLYTQADVARAAGALQNALLRHGEPEAVVKLLLELPPHDLRQLRDTLELCRCDLLADFVRLAVFNTTDPCVLHPLCQLAPRAAHAKDSAASGVCLLNNQSHAHH